MIGVNGDLCGTPSPASQGFCTVNGIPILVRGDNLIVNSQSYVTINGIPIVITANPNPIGILAATGFPTIS